MSKPQTLSQLLAYTPSLRVYRALHIPQDLIDVLERQQATTGIRSPSIAQWFEDYRQEAAAVEAWLAKVQMLYGVEELDVDRLERKAA